ncbi:hypothetical protein [Pseudomonas alkylphenolica]|uniref:hypothetical protein n=1 Tax=Pseudomonas alkylphenolica TaxID=237609 RepID=UPI0018D7B444|nr:hypothetical protein [Pseudomonas alkylphenolica]MBH3426504.1 hypothetical protein [Pseudomonas alkylphenolica]
MGENLVQITLSGGEVVSFEDTEYSLEFPAADLITGADGSQAYLLKAGTFSIKTPEFKGWFGAEGVTVDGTFYEVKRSFKVPVQDEDWLIYPVGH